MEVSHETSLDPADRWLSVGQAAEILGVHPSTVRLWGAEHKIPELRVGARRDRRYKKSAVLHLKSQRDAEETSDGVSERPLTRTTSSMGSLFAAIAGMDTFSKALVGNYTSILQAAGYASALANSINTTNAALGQWNLGFSRQIAEIMRPTALTGIAQATAQLQLGVGGNLAASVIASQAAIGTDFATIAGLLQTSSASRFLEVALPSHRAIDQLALIASRNEAPPIALEQSALTLRGFRDFTETLAERFPQTPRSEADSGITVDELGAGSEILAGSLQGIEHVAQLAQPEPLRIVLLPPTAYKVLEIEVDERRGELLELPPHRLMAELSQALSVQISREATRLVMLRYRCAKATERSRGEPIFKATTETDYAAGMLPQWVASTEDEFAQFIDLIYKYIYESSGDLGRLAAVFIESHSVLVTVKWLRHYYRHDLDHGSHDEAARKFRRIGDVFRELAGSAELTSPSQWRMAQLRLLTRLSEALQDLYGEIAADAGPNTSRGSTTSAD